VLAALRPHMLDLARERADAEPVKHFETHSVHEF
jgi:hypothetical protein